MAKTGSRYKSALYIMKIIIYIGILLFTGSFLSNVEAQEINQPLSNLKELVSEQYGTIRDSYFAGNDKGIIIHIQDLHCNYDAQMSIYYIIDELINKYNLKLVATEGLEGPLETSQFSKLIENDEREILAKYYLSLGRFSGPAYAHFLRRSGFKFFGADSDALHKDNVEAYKVSLKEKSGAKKYYDNVKPILEGLKAKAYSKELKELDGKIQGYKKEDLDFSEYVQYINGLIDKYDLDGRNYPNFVMLVEVLGKEAEIDFLEVDNQRSTYIDILSESLDKNTLSELMDKSLYFKTGKISALKFYDYIYQLSLKDNTPALDKDYGQLAKYIEYIKLYAAIENAALFKEMDLIEKQLKDKLFRNDAERRIDRFSYNLEVINDLFNLKLTQETLAYYRQNRKEFAALSVINFITENAPKYGVKYDLDPSFRGIDAKLPDLEKFYTLAEERDKILVENTLNKMRQEKAGLVVLVSGGFHTDGIKKLLKEKELSYVVITPKVEKLQDESVYAAVLLGGKDELALMYDTLLKNAKK